MSNSQILRNISLQLRRALWQGLRGDEAVGGDLIGEGSISLDSPERLADNGGTGGNQGQVVVSLYLYQVLPNAHLNNRPLLSDSSGQQHYPPLTLNLFYLLTPLGGSPEQDLLLLGRTMQIMASVPTLSSSLLDSQLRPPAAEARLLLNPLNLEEMTRIWNAFSQPYRLSVAYQVQVVSIDSVRPTESRVPVLESVLDVQQVVAVRGDAP